MQARSFQSKPFVGVDFAILTTSLYCILHVKPLHDRVKSKYQCVLKVCA